MIHSFNTDVAKECGLLAATIFHHIGYWVDYNQKNGFNFHDGRYWTYNSKRAFAEQFYYCSEKQVRTALQSLRDAGLIECGNYNKSPYDRTLWYSITDKGQRYNDWSRTMSDDGLAHEVQDIGPTGPINWPDGAKTMAQEVQPIPDRKPIRSPSDRNLDGKHIEGGKPPTRTKKQEPKETFGEYSHIKLTPTELERLKADYGEAETEEAITFLDEYIEMKGTKYKSHYLALKKWVFTAVEEQRKRKRNAHVEGRLPEGGYDWDSL